MRIVRCEDAAGRVHIGKIDARNIVTRIDGDLYGEYRVTSDVIDARKILAPVVPSQVLGIGLNYRRHAEESNMPVPQYPILFMKSLNAVQNPDDPIRLPGKLISEEVDYEAELAVVIGKICRNATREDALGYVLGYTCANDVSARDWQIKRGGSQWCRGKSFDTFCPLGPVLVTSDEIADPNSLAIKMTVSGTVYQDWNTDDMIFDVPALIEFLSSDTTLLPGTVILTGTPQGVGMAQKPPRWLVPGDTVAVEIAGIGRLTNPVTAAG